MVHGSPRDSPVHTVLPQVRVTLLSSTCSCAVSVRCAHAAGYNRNFACSRTCNATLRCGQHLCKRQCHAPPCDLPLPDGADSKSCGSVCNAPRSECSHRCQAICHPSSLCPRTPCLDKTTVSCECGRRTKVVVCYKGGSSADMLRPDPNTETSLFFEPIPCDDDCLLALRNQRLAEAFGRAPDGADVTHFSTYLTTIATTCPTFIKRVEQSFQALISSPTATTHHFPPMPSHQRKIIHELAMFYGLSSQSFDQEPKRNVVVAKTPKSQVPSRLLSSFTTGPIPKVPGTGSGINHGKPAAMLMYELTPDIRTEHITSWLRPFHGEYQLQWIDDHSCVAIFNQVKVMQTALSALSGGIVSFKVAPCSDLKNPDKFDAEDQTQTPPSSRSTTATTARAWGGTTAKARQRTYSCPPLLLLLRRSPWPICCSNLGLCDAQG